MAPGGTKKDRDKRGCEIRITVQAGKATQTHRWCQKTGIWCKRGKHNAKSQSHTRCIGPLMAFRVFWSRNSSLPFTHSAVLYSSICCIFHQRQYSLSCQCSLSALCFCPLYYIVFPSQSAVMLLRAPLCHENAINFLSIFLFLCYATTTCGLKCVFSAYCVCACMYCISEIYSSPKMAVLAF